ncbi:DUF6084 family protein [Streptomyces macrosporus]|uniref:Uncharacterized protein n=1 Tax=Streptomyces macrosporus TaxID=44032 RepID=A0ABP5XA79_9ACTN
MTAPRTAPDGVPARHAVPSLAFTVTDARPERFAAVPTLRFELGIARTGGGPVRSISLTASVRIDVTRRRYDDRTRRALAELFGAPERWGTTLRPLAWTRTTVVVPPFTDTTTVALTVPCPCDAELAVTKYLYAVRDGEVPLDFLFNGTVFFQAPDGGLRTAQISWAEDACYRLPAGLWHDLIDRYFAGSPWLRLSRETYERLDAYRARRVLTTWDDTIGSLLDQADGPIPELSRTLEGS